MIWKAAVKRAGREAEPWSDTKRESVERKEWGGKGKGGGDGVAQEGETKSRYIEDVDGVLKLV